MLEAKVNGSGATRAAVELVAHDATPPDAGGEVETLALANLPFAEEIYFQFLRDPGSVAPEWRRLFEQLDGGNDANGVTAAAVVPPTSFPRSIFGGPPASAPGAIQSRISVRLLSERVQRLVEGYRERGHLFADLDPLGLTQRGGPDIALERYGLAEEDLDLVFSSENVAGPDRTTLRDLMGRLRETWTPILRQ